MKIYTALTTARAVDITAKIVESRPKDIDKKVYVFCESKLSLSFERAIASACGGSFNTEVLSFSRYVSKNARVENYLSKSSAAMTVRMLMASLKGELSRIKPNAFSVPKEMYQLISQLKSALVTPDDLDTVVEKEDGTFKSKLKDVALIYRAYEDFIAENSLTDESNYLSLMPSLVFNDESLKGAKVVVAAVQSYTKQTLDIVKALAKVADLDFVCVSAGEACYTNECINKITQCFQSAEVIEDDFSYSQETLTLARGLFNPDAYSKEGVFSSKIQVLEADDVKAECEAVAKRIRYEVVKNGRRYKDFAVVCPDVNVYSKLMAESFLPFDIPYYSDKKSKLSDHPVNRLIGGLIDVKRLNMLPKSVCSTVKTGLFCGEEDAWIFDGYCRNNVVSRRSIKEPFSDLVAESVRSLVLNVYDLLPRSGTVNEMLDAIEKAFDLIGLSQRLEKLSISLKELGEGYIAEYNEGCLKAVKELFGEIRGILGDTQTNLGEIKNILASAMASVEISTIPEYNDVVFIGDFKGARQRTSEVVFAVGMTSNVPYLKADVALINDRELNKMDGYKLIIEPKLQIVNKRERENIAVSLMSFTDRLFISYPLLDEKGKAAVKSEIVDYILKIFSSAENKLKIVSPSRQRSLTTAEDSFLGYMSPKKGIYQSAVDVERFKERQINSLANLSAFLAAAKEADREKVLAIACEEEKGLFDVELSYKGNFSASSIESYFDCPYKSFVRYSLKLQDPLTGEVRAFEIGNVIHSVMEIFLQKLNEIDDPSKAVTLGKEILREQLKMPLYARYLNKSQYKYVFNLLEKEVVGECIKVFEDAKNSEFKPIGAEIAFNESSKFKPLILNTVAGAKKLRGKIDRVDTYKDYFRIIDYKTGSVDENGDEGLYTGKKIQLYLYMNVMEREGLKPAGAYYYKLGADFSKNGSEYCKFIGRSLADKDTLSLLDKKFKESGKSDALSIKLTKEGGFSLNSKIMSQSQFEDYSKYAQKIAENGANEMLKGCITPTPYEGGCDYCIYKGLCGYDQETGDKTRKVKGLSKEAISAALEVDDE